MPNNIKKLRTEKGLTLQALSELTGIQKGTLASYESKEVMPRKDKVNILSKFFDVQAAYILGLSKFKDEYENINEAEETGDRIVSFLGFDRTDFKNLPKSSNELYNLTYDIYEEAYNLTLEEKAEFEAIIYNFLLMSDSERNDVIKYSEFLLSKKGYSMPLPKNK